MTAISTLNDQQRTNNKRGQRMDPFFIMLGCGAIPLIAAVYLYQKRDDDFDRSLASNIKVLEGRVKRLEAVEVPEIPPQSYNFEGRISKLEQDVSMLAPMSSQEQISKELNTLRFRVDSMGDGLRHPKVQKVEVVKSVPIEVDVVHKKLSVVKPKPLLERAGVKKVRR